MTDAGLLEQAHAALLRAFSSSLRAPYAEGKAQMADQVTESLRLPHETAVALVDDLEKSGRLRFEGPLGVTTSPPPLRESGVYTPKPVTPHIDASGVRPEAIPAQPVLGEWIIASGRP
jgi:hypothetical protein